MKYQPGSIHDPLHVASRRRVPPRPGATRIAWAAAALLISIVSYGVGSRIAHTEPAPSPGGAATGADISRLLASLSVVDTLADAPGYDRKCNPGRGCVFGPAWTDDYNGPGGHDGCGTRDQILARQLHDVEYKPRTHNCVVVAGVLDPDPYTGQRIAFTKQRASDIQVDHVVPLAAAWRMGASAWTIEQRTSFANDIDANLIAVEGKVNGSKSDQTIGEWLPPNTAFHCQYVTRFLVVASKYGLSITTADARAARAAC
jgi:hypothetical protein